jgi:hypothetical protein
VITFSVNPVGDTKQYRTIKERSSDIDLSYIGEYFDLRNDTGNFLKTFEAFLEEVKRKNGSKGEADLPLDAARNKSNNSSRDVSLSLDDDDIEKIVAELYKIVFRYIEDQTGENYIDLLVRVLDDNTDSAKNEKAELGKLMKVYDDCQDIFSELHPDIDVIQIFEKYKEESDIKLDFSLISFVKHFRRFETYFI